MTRSMTLPACLAAFGLLLTACGGGGGGDEGSRSIVGDTVPVQPANPESRRADVLATCTYSDRNTPCTLNTLPLLGMDVAEPGVEDVMDRTLVSHPWMTLRFRELLNDNPPITAKLARAVTAVVIARNVRPSVYRVSTGAIYFDPRYLWQTLEEKDTIDRDEDERVSFGAELNYRILWRYVLGDEYAYRGFDWDDREPRTLEDTRYRASQVLLHEFAHANDFFPPGTLNQLDRNQPPFVAHQAVADQGVAPALQDSFPKQSELMFDLAEVLFFGREARASERALSPADVTRAFSGDAANDDYAYSTIREDVAMLFEEVMMKRYFNTDRDVGVTDNPEGDDLDADDYTVDWGQRGRIGDANVKARAQLVTDRMIPSENLDTFYASLAEPIPMRAGESWEDNLTPATAGDDPDAGSGNGTGALPRSRRTPPQVQWLPID